MFGRGGSTSVSGSAGASKLERVAAGEAGAGAEVGFDREEAVVLGEALGARDRADLDLAGGGGHGEVGDGGVLGLARAGRDDGAVAVAAGQVERERVSERVPTW